MKQLEAQTNRKLEEFKTARIKETQQKVEEKKAKF